MIIIGKPNDEFENEATQAYGGSVATQEYQNDATQAYGGESTQAYANTATQAYGAESTQAYANTATQAYGAESTQAYANMATQPFHVEFFLLFPSVSLTMSQRKVLHCNTALFLSFSNINSTQYIVNCAELLNLTSYLY